MFRPPFKAKSRRLPATSDAAPGDNVVSLSETRGAAATKERILDSAESLFMEHGFEATSLRSITAAAAVNPRSTSIEASRTSAMSGE